MTDLFGMATIPTQPHIGDQLHEAEVRDCIRRYYPDGRAMADYLALVEKKRGHGPAERLRVDCRKAWAEKRGGK